jgi:MFS family permease
MSFSDVLDGAFRLLRANLATILLVTAVFFVPLELLSAFLSRDLFGGQSLLRALQDPSLTEQDLNSGFSGFELGGTVGTSLLGLLITPFVGGAITQVVAASYLGQQLSWSDAIKITGRRLWALLGAAIFVHLLEGVGLVLCVLPALVVMTFLICTTPAVVIEWLGPIRSMRRSFALVRPRFWPVLGIAVVSGLLTTFLTWVLSAPFTLAAEVVGLRWGFLLLAVGSIVPALLASPFVSIVATLVYFDARIRHEGFDLQMIARGFADGDAAAH